METTLPKVIVHLSVLVVMKNFVEEFIELQHMMVKVSSALIFGSNESLMSMVIIFTMHVQVVCLLIYIVLQRILPFFLIKYSEEGKIISFE